MLRWEVVPSHQTPRNAALASVVRPSPKSVPMSYGKRGLAGSIGGSDIMPAVHEERVVRGRGSDDSKSSGSHNRVGQVQVGQEVFRGLPLHRDEEALRDLSHATLPPQSVLVTPRHVAPPPRSAAMCPESPDSGDTGNSTSTTSTAREKALAKKAKEHALKMKEKEK